MRFGDRLRQERRRRHLSQETLAEALGCDPKSIRRWERNQASPQLFSRLQISRFFGIPPDELFAELEKSAPPAFLWHVPSPRNPFFTGREEILEALHAQLGPAQTVALTQSSALHGLGGVGKTQIALEYAYRYALEYSAIFWIAAETEEQVVSSLLRVADVLQLPGREDQDQQCVVAAVQRWLSTHGQWLLIWDNVEDLAILGRFLPATRAGSILLTTRRRALGTIAQGLDLLPMAQEEGVFFLLRRARMLPAEASRTQMHQWAASRPVEAAAARELVTVLGSLPLALDQAGAYLEATQCGLVAYLALFRTHRDALLQQRGEGARDHPASVSTTFTLALAATAEHHPAVETLLRVCAFLQPDAIPEELFHLGAVHLGAALEAACRDALAWNRVLAVARSSSLLSRQASEQTISLHRLVQAVVLDAMTEAEREEWAGRVIEALNAVFPSVRPDTEAVIWKQAERLLSHTLLHLQRIEQAKQALPFASLAHKVGQYLQVRGQYEQAGSLYQRVLHLREQLLGSEHLLVAEVLYDLAILAKEQGRSSEGELLCRRALQIREQTLGCEHLLVAEALYGLATLSFRQGKYPEAEALYQRVLRIWERDLGSEHPQVATALNNLALLYYTLDKLTEAEALYQRALQIQERSLGPEHPQVAFALNNLAILYSDLGKHEQAGSLYQRALHIREQALGPEHPLVASSLNNLANFYSEQGKDPEAEALHQQALQIREQSLGPEHPDVAISLINVAELSSRQGKDAQAEPLFRRALRILEQQLGPEHPNVAYALIGLAELSSKQDKDAQAELLFQRALHIREQAFGPENSQTATLLNALANLASKQGKDTEAEALFQRALTIREKQLGSHHPETAQTLHDLAIFRQKQDHLSDALSLAERALEIRSRFLGDTHPQTIATRALFAQLLQEQAGQEKEMGIQ